MTYIADLSEQHGVDAIYVGSYQSGFDSVKYQKEWQHIVDSVRSVFDGKLTYQQWADNTDNVVWKMVDYISAGIRHDLSERYVTDPDQIVDLYYRDDTGYNTVADFLALKKLFPDKPVVIDGIAFDAGADSITYGSFYDDLMSGKTITQDDFHYDVQTARIQAIFDLVEENPELNDMISGFSVRELMPWTDLNWIQNPSTPEQTNWHLAMSLNFNLFHNQIALDAYRAELFDGATVITGTDNNDRGRLSDTGDYYINGKNGTDTLEITGRLSDSSLVYDGQYYFLENNNRSVTLDQVERVKFDDGKVIAFDFEDNNSAGGIYRLYQSVFHRDPDAEGFGYWVNKLDQGMSQVEICNHMLWNSQFQRDLGITTTNGYGEGVDPRIIVTELYQHLLDREPDAEGLEYWSNQLASRSETVGQVICDFANITQYDNHINDVTNYGMHYQYWDPVWG